MITKRKRRQQQKTNVFSVKLGKQPADIADWGFGTLGIPEPLSSYAQGQGTDFSFFYT
jgi:hypothetical protein